MDIPGSTQMDVDENASWGHPSKQGDSERNEVCWPGRVGDERAIGTHTDNDNNLCKPASRAIVNGNKLVDDLCNPPNKPAIDGCKLVDDIYNPLENPQMAAHDNGSCGYARKREDSEQNGVAKSGGEEDDCTNRIHTDNDNNLCNTMSKLALEYKLVDDLYKLQANPKMDADENRSCGYPVKLRICKQNGVVNPGGEGDDCTSEPPFKPNINEDKLVDDLCNPPPNPQMDADEDKLVYNLCIPPPNPHMDADEDKLVDDLCNPPPNPQMGADENGSCGYPSKQENCKHNKVVKPGRAEDECNRGTHSNNGNTHNLCNSASKPIIHGYSYKLVDDFIFSDRSLIGRFTRLRPSVQELSQWSNNNWSSKLRSIWMFKMIGHGFFKIEFFGQEDCEFVMENGPWFMGVAGLSLKRWSPDFDPQNPGPLKTPVWMSLLDLPLEFWNEDSLMKICSKVGKVLQIAEGTTEMNGGTTPARVCVEVDLKEGLMASIDLHCSGASLTQDLDYEGIPFRCKICRSADHLDGSCPKKSAKNARKKK